MNDLIQRLRTPCGRTTGHGESCSRGWECGACVAKAKAADELERLQARVAELECRPGSNPMIQSALDAGEDATGLCTVREMTWTMYSGEHKADKCEIYFVHENTAFNVELHITKVNAAIEEARKR